MWIPIMEKHRGQIGILHEKWLGKYDTFVNRGFDFPDSYGRINTSSDVHLKQTFWLYGSSVYISI